MRTKPLSDTTWSKFSLVSSIVLMPPASPRVRWCPAQRHLPRPYSRAASACPPHGRIHPMRPSEWLVWPHEQSRPPGGALPVRRPRLRRRGARTRAPEPPQVPLGESTEVRRLLPNLGRRMVGAWVFVDHYGPDDIASEPGMRVPPHPHTGLQTVSWLHEGEVLHRDSTGSVQTIRPYELGLMTSGRAISHSNRARTPTRASCTAPSCGPPSRHPPPRRPALRVPRAPAAGHRARTDRHGHPRHARRRHLPGHHLHAPRRRRRLPRPRHRHPPPRGADFEYAALAMSGETRVDGVPLLPGSMLYLGCGRTELPCAPSPTRP